MYVPSKGDFVHLNRSPQAGKEWAGPHYGLVLSEQKFVIASGLAFICPITTKVDKVAGFVLPIPPGGKIRGALITAQIRAIDFQKREVTFESKAPGNLVAAALHHMAQIMGI